MHTFLIEATNCVDSDLVRLVDEYQPSSEAVDFIKHMTLVFLVGISGAGKNTIKNNLLETGKYYDLVTHTTRKPRKNHGILEVNHKDYHFIDFEQARKLLKTKQYIEAKRYNGNIYGASITEFEKAVFQKKIPIADIDVRGVDEFRKIAASSIKPIFLLPPSFEVWEHRFKVRYEGQVGEGEFRGRLSAAIEEIEHVLSKDYYHIVINDDLNDTVEQVNAVAHGEVQNEVALQHSIQVAQTILQRMKQT